MLNFNSQINLQKNLRSSNAIRGLLKSNKGIRKEVMNKLQQVYQETGELPYKKYPEGMYELLKDMYGTEVAYELLKDFSFTKSYIYG